MHLRLLADLIPITGIEATADRYPGPSEEKADTP